MKKLLLFFPIITIICYTGGWFWIASKVENQLSQIFIPIQADTKTSEKKEDLFQNISVNGFPFSFKVTLKEGKYTSPYLQNTQQIIPESVDDQNTVQSSKKADTTKDTETPASQTKTTPIEFELGSDTTVLMNLGEQTISLFLPNYIFAQDPISNDDLLINYPEMDGTIEVAFKSKNIFVLYDLLFNLEDFKSPLKLTNKIDRFSYGDGGFFLFNANEVKEENLLYSSQKNLFSISITDIEEYYKDIRLYYNYENAKVNDKYYIRAQKNLAKHHSEQEIKVLNWVLDENKKSGSSSAEFDITYTGFVDPLTALTKKQFNLVINRLAYSDHQFSLSMQSSLALDNEGIEGWGVAEIGNYVRLIDFISRFYNTVIVSSIRKDVYERSNIFLAKLKVEHIELIKRIIPQLGRVSGDEKNIIIQFSKAKNSPHLRIGNMTSLKLKKLFRKELKRINQSYND